MNPLDPGYEPKCQKCADIGLVLFPNLENFSQSSASLVPCISCDIGKADFKAFYGEDYMFASVALIMNDNKVLAISRKNEPNNLGLPGGKVEVGESPAECIVRELKEEVGLDVRVQDVVPYFMAYVARPEPVMCYKILDWQGEPRACEDGYSVAWVPFSRICEPQCTFASFNAALLAQIESELAALDIGG
jgi:mutator protein MutT